MSKFKACIILVHIFLGLLVWNSMYSASIGANPDHGQDYIKELRSMFPDLLQSDIESLFGQHAETFAKLQMFAQAIERRNKFVITSKNLQTFLSADNLKTFARYVSSDEFQKRLETMQDRNPILVALAKKWIRNAALRIFSDPLRSFLELIVNACDATVGAERAVGKFGMGFFSILSLLSHPETDGTVINLRTVCRSDFGISGYFAYSMTFAKTGPELNVWDDLAIEFKQLNDSALDDFLRELMPTYKVGELMPTGTIITITPKNTHKRFSQATLNSLKNYISYMVGYRRVPIYLNDDPTPINKNVQADDIALVNKYVNVFILPNQLKVVDRGSGINLSVALSSLLIPSSSTKSKIGLAAKQGQALRSGIESSNFIDLPYKSNKLQSHFLITVNDVVVVDRIMPEAIKNYDGKITDFKINMPQAVRLTLSRDEILISEDGKSYEEAYLKNIINKTVSDVLQKKLSSSHLLAMYKGLSAWELQSALRIKGRFTGYFKQVLQNQLQSNEFILPVPLNYFTQLSQIFAFFAGVQAASYVLLPMDPVLVNYDFSRFEKNLTDYVSKKALQADAIFQDVLEKGVNYRLIRGMRVIFVPGNILSEVSTLGMRTLLFVSENELKDLNNVAENIVAKCSELDLSSSGKFEFNSVRLVISTFSDQINFASPQNLNSYRFNLFTKDLAKQFTDNKSLGFMLRLENGRFTGILTDKFILKILGVHAIPEFTTFDNYLNFVLLSTLVKFGAMPNNLKKGQIFITDSNGKLKKLWPLEHATVQDFALMLMSCLWCLVNNADLNFVKNDGSFVNGKDYFMSLMYMEISRCFNVIPLSQQNPKYEREWAPPGVVRVKNTIESFDFIGFGLQPTSLDCAKLINNVGSVFVGYKGVSDVRLSVELEELFQFISPAINYDQTLKFACPNFSSTRAFLDLFLLKKSVEKLIKNKERLASVFNFIEVISGFYLQYFNIPENEFGKTYGKTSTVKVNEPDFQSDSVDLAKLLNVISSDKNTFERVLQLQINDFANQTNVSVRSQDLTDGKIYIPKLTSNSVLSLLSRFYNSLVNVDSSYKVKLVRQIVDSVSGADELCFVLQLFLVGNNLAALKDLLTDISVDDFDLLIVQIKDLIQRFIHEKVDEFFILDFYNKCRTEKLISLEYRIKLLSEMPISKLIQEYLRSVWSDKRGIEYNGYQAEVNELVKSGRLFTLRKLMRAHFGLSGLKAELQNNDLRMVLKKVNKVKTLVDTGKIIQAVESGSQRGYAESACLECLQNSVDAIRGFFKKLKNGGDKSFKQSFDLRMDTVNDLYSVKFDLFLVKKADPDKSGVLLTIQDFVGMYSLESLLADLVLPDYSRKTPAEGNIGDMGNGTFKIYQFAEEVTVKTRLVGDPSKIFVLQIRPHRNNDGLVDDLDLKCVQLKPVGRWHNFWGTRFEILFRDGLNSETLVESLSIKDFIKNSAGATNVLIEEQKHSIDVYFKNEKINNISEDDLLTEYRRGGSILFKVYKRENKLLQSYITTGGIPFRALLPVAHEMALLPNNFISNVGNGLIINLELETYQPVQSRTRLNISEQMLKNLRECLLETFYLYTLDQSQNNKQDLGTIFTHFLSTYGDFAQLKLNKNETFIFTDTMQAFLAGTLSFGFFDKRLFFSFYEPLVAIQNKKQQQKSFFDFIDNEFDGGLVKRIDQLLNKYQADINKQFKDKSISDQEYEKSAKLAQAKFSAELAKLYVDWRNNILVSGNLPKILIEKVIVPWFELKCNDIFLNIKSRIKLSKSTETARKYEGKFLSTSFRHLRALLDSALTAYGNIYFKLNNVAGIAPKVNFEICPPGELGHFDQALNAIAISPSRSMLITNFLKMLKALINKHYQDVKNNDAYNLLFGIRRGAKCGVVPHELLHAVMRTDDTFHPANFEEQAKQRVIDIISNLFIDWSTETVKLFETSQDFILKFIDENSQKIEQFERYDQQALFIAIYGNA